MHASGVIRATQTALRRVFSEWRISRGVRQRTDAWWRRFVPTKRQVFGEKVNAASIRAEMESGGTDLREALIPFSLHLTYCMAGLVADVRELPAVRKLVEEHRKSGREAGYQWNRLVNLLTVLDTRSITLLPEHMEKLQSMAWGALPKLRVALVTLDADDFARRAGL